MNNKFDNLSKHKLYTAISCICGIIFASIALYFYLLESNSIILSIIEITLSFILLGACYVFKNNHSERILYFAQTNIVFFDIFFIISTLKEYIRMYSKADFEFNILIQGTIGCVICLVATIFGIGASYNRFMILRLEQERNDVLNYYDNLTLENQLCDAPIYESLKEINHGIDSNFLHYVIKSKQAEKINHGQYSSYYTTDYVYLRKIKQGKYVYDKVWPNFKTTETCLPGNIMKDGSIPYILNMPIAKILFKKYGLFTEKFYVMEEDYSASYWEAIYYDFSDAIVLKMIKYYDESTGLMQTPVREQTERVEL